MTDAKIVEQRIQGKKAAVALGFGACDAGINATLENTVIEIQDRGDHVHIVVKK